MGRTILPVDNHAILAKITGKSAYEITAGNFY